MLDEILKLIKNRPFYEKSGSYPSKEREARECGEAIAELLNSHRETVSAETVAKVMRADNEKHAKPPESPMSPMYIGRVLAHPDSPLVIMRR